MGSVRGDLVVVGEGGGLDGETQEELPAIMSFYTGRLSRSPPLIALWKRRWTILRAAADDRAAL